MGQSVGRIPRTPQHSHSHSHSHSHWRSLPFPLHSNRTPIAVLTQNNSNIFNNFIYDSFITQWYSDSVNETQRRKKLELTPLSSLSSASFPDYTNGIAKVLKSESGSHYVTHLNRAHNRYLPLASTGGRRAVGCRLMQSLLWGAMITTLSTLSLLVIAVPLNQWLTTKS